MSEPTALAQTHGAKCSRHTGVLQRVKKTLGDEKFKALELIHARMLNPVFQCF